MEESNCERDHQAHTQADSTPGYCRVPDIRFRGFTYAWERRKLDETVSFYSGLTYSPSDICDAGGTLVLRSSNVQSGELAFVDNVYVNDSVASSEQVRKNDLIVVVRNGSRALLGKHAIIRDDMPKTVIGAFMTGIRSDEQEFMNALMSSRAFESEINKNLGATINQITGGMFAEMTFSMPDESEQHAIGSLFFKLDSLVTLHQRKLNKLHHIKKALLEKMFPTPGSTIPDIRFQGFTEAWERRRLGDVVKEVTRNEPTSYAPIMMITANNGFIEQSERYAFNNAGESLKKYILLEKGELAYNHGASKLRPYGSCFALTTRENARIPFVYHCFSSDEQNSEFLSIELNGADVENQLRRIVSSGARMDGLLNISFQEYASVSVLLPSVEEQDRIAAFFNDLDSLATLYQHQLNKLHSIKKALLEKMFV